MREPGAGGGGCRAGGRAHRLWRARSLPTATAPAGTAQGLERPALSPSDGNAGAKVSAGALQLAVFNDPQLLAMPGGEPVIVDGLAIGGVGISGLPPELDAGLAARFVQRLT